MTGRLARRLNHPRFPFHAALLAVLLASPSLQVGWIADDFSHQLAIKGGRGPLMSLPVNSWNPFKFWDGDPLHNHAIKDLGIAPWWTHPNIKAVFHRPLTVVFHRLDYALWPNSPILMHLQSLLWFGAVIAAVAYLYRRVGGATWSAGLAALLYALDDAHAMPAAWIANRSTLLATLFGVLALLAHHQWRAEHSRRSAILAPIWLTISLLSKEEGLGATAYLFAYALFLDHAPWQRRWLSLAPYAVVVLVWRIGWSLAGGGVENAGLYVDPLHDPTGFLHSIVKWAPLTLLGQWAFPPPDIALMLEVHGVHPYIWYPALAFILLAAIVMVPVLRRDRLSGFYALGMLLSLLPISASLPGDRLLYFTGIGAMGLLARFLETLTNRRKAMTFQPESLMNQHDVLTNQGDALANESESRETGPSERQDDRSSSRAVPTPVGAAWRSSASSFRQPPLPHGRGSDQGMAWRSRSPASHLLPAKILAVFFVFIHGVLAPIFLPLRAAYPLGPKSLLDQMMFRASMGPEVAHQDVILVNTPFVLFTAYLPIMRTLDHLAVPRHVRNLSPSAAAVTLYRPDENTLIVRPDPCYLEPAMDRLFRYENAPFQIGDQITLTGLTIEIKALNERGLPCEVAFHFAESLNDPSLRWFQWKDGDFNPFTPPAVGETVQLPVAMPRMF